MLFVNFHTLSHIHNNCWHKVHFFCTNPHLLDKCSSFLPRPIANKHPNASAIRIYTFATLPVCSVPANPLQENTFVRVLAPVRGEGKKRKGKQESVSYKIKCRIKLRKLRCSKSAKLIRKSKFLFNR